MANTVPFGFMNVTDILSRHVNPDIVPVIREAVQVSLTEHNRVWNQILSRAVQRTTQYKYKYRLASGGAMQPLDEHGKPRPRVPAGVYEVALPIRRAGDAWGANWEAKHKMTVQDVAEFVDEAMIADVAFLRTMFLAAIFTNVTYTWSDEKYGNLTIQPLANADTVTYVNVGGTSGTAQHFLAQANAISDTDNPFPTIYNLLTNYPSNMGPYVVYVPTTNVEAVKGLSSFVEAPSVNINYGDGVSTSRASTNGNAPFDRDDAGFGDRVLGFVDDVKVIHWRSLPANYLIGHAEGAPAPIGMREDDDTTSLHGLIGDMVMPDGDNIEWRYRRLAGFGALNRVGMCVQRVGNGSYAIPSGYNAAQLPYG